ncbi:MAG: PilZ domain-containing protein [Planctomycetota bacterium]
MSIHARREPRHVYKVPARLEGQEGAAVHGMTQDLSRRGVRLRLRLDALCPQAPRFAEVLERIREGYGRRASIVLPGAGPSSNRTLAKEAIVVRLVSETDGPEAIDVGLLFLDPLSEEEAALLGAPMGVAIPGEDAPDRAETDWDQVAQEPAGPPQRTPRLIRRGATPGVAASGRHMVSRPKQRHKARLDSLRPGGRSQDGFTEVLTSEAVLVRLKGAAVDVHGDIRPLPEVAAKFSELYGERVRLSLGGGGGTEPVWRGWGRLGGFEAALDDPADIIVIVALERAMDAETRIRVGLDQPA